MPAFYAVFTLSSFSHQTSRFVNKKLVFMLNYSLISVSVRFDRNHVQWEALLHLCLWLPPQHLRPWHWSPRTGWKTVKKFGILINILKVDLQGDNCGCHRPQCRQVCRPSWALHRVWGSFCSISKSSWNCTVNIKYMLSTTTFPQDKDVCVGPLIKYTVFDAFFGALCGVLLILGSLQKSPVNQLQHQFSV